MTSQVLATVIGDVIGSRLADDRHGLHTWLDEALAEANARLEPLVPFRITVGDEYQGCFADVGAALEAVLTLRLAGLGAGIDLRHGVGWGEVSVLAAEPRVEDGPGWWAARAAIETVETDEFRAGLRRTRTTYRKDPATDGPAEAPVNAALLLRDHVLGGLSPRSVSVLRGLLAGRSQRELAEDLGISPSAVSQRVRADGIAVLVEVEELLRTVR